METLRSGVGGGVMVTRYPIHGVIGLVLIGTSWSLSWLHFEPVGRYTFFWLWLGYILVVDAIVARRTGSSLLTDSPLKLAWMFVASAPLWWVFEGINQLTNNWVYVGVSDYSDLEYFLLATWNFSTVIPAVFQTAQLLSSFRLFGKVRHGPKIPLDNRALTFIVIVGLLAIPAMALWPRFAFPLAWLCVLLIFDPINLWLDRPNIASLIVRGDWRIPITFALGTLICGWFWEMWNFYALPKWEYIIPYVDFLPVFEMPILGYLGYLPFGLEVYVGYHFITGWFVASAEAERVAESV